MIQPTNVALHRESPRDLRSPRSDSNLRIRHVLIALDGSPLAERGVPYSVAIARAFSCPLTLTRVLDTRRAETNRRGLDAFAWEAERNEARDYLHRAQTRLADECEDVGVELLEGDPAEQVLNLADERDVDLIVITSHGEGGPSQWRLSSTAQKMVNRANASILLVPVGTDAIYFDNPRGPRRILVPLDCSQRAECVLPLVQRLSAAHGADVVLAHAAPAPEMPRALAPSREDLLLAERLTVRNVEEARRYLSSVAGRLVASGAEVSTRAVVSKRGTRTLLDIAAEEEIDLIVLNAHGHTGDPDDVFGGVTARLLASSRIPILVVRDLSCAPRASLPASLRSTIGPGS